MNKIPYADTDGFLSVEVHLQYAADVFLVDSINFQHYNNGRKFSYYGGNYTQTPVNISVEGTGRWYLIVRGGGKYKYRFY